MSETWRPVVGYEGYYEVSNNGRVRTVGRISSYGRPVRERVLKPDLSGIYPQVKLARDGRGRTSRIHALVAEAFIGPRPAGMEVCHTNGNHADNRLENLRYDTHSENQRDTVRLGLHPLANLTECHRGHPLPAPAVGIARVCKTCRRDYDREYSRRARAEGRKGRSAMISKAN